MNKIAIKWWCDECKMYITDSPELHESRKEQFELTERQMRARQITDETEDQAGDFSGASYDVDGGR